MCYRWSFRKSAQAISAIEARVSCESRVDEKQFAGSNHIFNYYGRPITSNNNLVNYWIQSSAVDFCSLAFDNFVKEFNLTKHFFIHDSMTFSVEDNRLDNILKVKSLTCPKSGISIPVEFNIIS